MSNLKLPENVWRSKPKMKLLKIINTLNGITTSEIGKIDSIPFKRANAMQHLDYLEKLNLVTSKKEIDRVYKRKFFITIKGKKILDLLNQLNQINKIRKNKIKMLKQEVKNE